MTSTPIVISKHIAMAQDRFFLAGCALLFTVCVTATVVGCVQMSAMGDMSMAGGWSMSMMWMLMPDQTWLDATASFTGMWTVMMVAMMMPALLPMLRSYRQSIGRVPSAQLELLTLVVAIGYFFIWLLVGLAVFPLGFWLAALTMQYTTLASVVPVVTGIIVILAGALQFTLWKTHQLSCCRNTKNLSIYTSEKITAAGRYGLYLGIHCNLCCAGLTVVLLLVGVMNPLAMLLVAIAITAERLAPTTKKAAKIVGVVLIGAGLYLLVHALGA